MSQITLGSCGPGALLSHLALYGLAAILESGGITGLRAGWNGSGDQRPYLTGPDLTGERAAQVVSRHAGQAADRGSWLHRSITLNGSPRALMSPRLTTFGDQTTWRQAQENRHQVLDSLTDQGRWLDLRFLAALGEPCYWVTDRQGTIQQDSAASRLEMQPRNIGSEFVGTRLRKLADAIAARTAGQILSGLLGDSVRDEAGGDAADSRTATGLAGPGPTDNALAWCALWGISQLPLAMRIKGIGRHHRASGPRAARILLRTHLAVSLAARAAPGHARQHPAADRRQRRPGPHWPPHGEPAAGSHHPDAHGKRDHRRTALARRARNRRRDPFPCPKIRKR